MLETANSDHSSSRLIEVENILTASSFYPKIPPGDQPAFFTSAAPPCM